MLKRTCVQCGKEFEMNQSEINFYKKKKLSLPKRCKECREMNKTAKKENSEKEEKQQIEEKQQTQEKQQIQEKQQTQEKQQIQVKQQIQEKQIKEKKEPKMSTAKKRLAYLVAAAAIILGGGGTAISTLNDAPAESTKIEQEVEVNQAATEKNADEIIADENADVVAGQDQSVETTYLEIEEITAEIAEETDKQNTEENSRLTEPVIVYEFRNQELLENHYKKHGMEMGFASSKEYLEAANRVIDAPDVLHKIEAEDGDDVYYLEETNEFVVVSGDGYIRTYFNPTDGIDYYNRQ